jgi:hypothetical protein
MLEAQRFRGIPMRFGLCALAAVTMAGCASQHGSAPAPVTRQVKVDASNVADVQHAGYKVVDRDGQKLYCRRDLITGSHVQSHTTCRTEEELAQQDMVNKQGLERIQMSPQTRMGK